MCDHQRGSERNRAKQERQRLSMRNINVTIWNEFRHEQEPGPAGDLIRRHYPQGMHRTLANYLAAPDLTLRPVSLDEPEQGLPEEILQTTDVLLWWGHCAHAEVKDELVDRVQRRVLAGMGLIVLHSGHYSKIFRRMMGTTCRLRWREVGEKERLWVVSPSHPIARGIPETFVIPHHEMYGEPFDIPADGRIVFMSWHEGGNVCRSGVAFERDRGRIFYFSPGHETFPVYHDPVIIQVISNAIRWAAPAEIVMDRITPQPQALEKIYSENPLAGCDTSALHQPTPETKKP
jgi:trehalose utilization protein